jgi:glycosyltransferase involved in cell wall biosynthesis
MRIAILSDEFLPNSTRIHAKMLHELAIELGNRGHEVVVITPNNSKGCDRLAYKNVDGAEVWFFRAPPTHGIGHFRRAINETLLSMYAILALKNSKANTKFDLCINYSPTIFFGPLAAWFGRKGCFVYLVLRDFFPQWIIDQALISNHSLAAYYFRFFERLNYRAADIIAVQSPANIGVFAQMHGGRFSSQQVLYNWSDIHRSKDSSFGEQLMLQNRLSDKVVFLYGGNMGHAQDMDNLMRLARGLKAAPEACLLFIGQGDELDLVNSRRVQWSLDNVTVLPSISQDQFKSVLSQVDVGIISLSSSHSGHNYPGKMLGYMVESLPILGSINAGNDLQGLVNRADAGFVCINGDDEGFLANALQLATDHSLRQRMGDQSKTLLNNVFSVERAATQILESIPERSNV